LNELERLQERLDRFSRERDWEQFHSAKNLSMALTVEAAELMEHFQWMTQEESNELTPDKRIEVAHELADILIYLARIAGRLDIDLLAAAFRKMDINEKKYPADAVRGSAKKYTEYLKPD